MLHQIVPKVYRHVQRNVLKPSQRFHQILFVFVFLLLLDILFPVQACNRTTCNFLQKLLVSFHSIHCKVSLKCVFRRWKSVTIHHIFPNGHRGIDSNCCSINIRSLPLPLPLLFALTMHKTLLCHFQLTDRHFVQLSSSIQHSYHFLQHLPIFSTRILGHVVLF